MKTVSLEKATLNTCVKDAQRDRVVLTRNGRPVALVVGVEGLDAEQVQLGSSNGFWTLISKRRAQKTVSRRELEKRISKRSRPMSKKTAPF